MRLSQDLQLCVYIVVFAERHKIPARDVVEMIHLSRRSKNAYERNDDKAEQRFADQVGKIAAKSGARVDWPGLWPTIKTDVGGEDLLPS